MLFSFLSHPHHHEPPQSTVNVFMILWIWTTLCSTSSVFQVTPKSTMSRTIGWLYNREASRSKVLKATTISAIKAVSCAQITEILSQAWSSIKVLPTQLWFNLRLLFFHFTQGHWNLSFPISQLDAQTNPSTYLFLSRGETVGFRDSAMSLRQLGIQHHGGQHLAWRVDSAHQLTDGICHHITAARIKNNNLSTSRLAYHHKQRIYQIKSS